MPDDFTHVRPPPLAQANERRRAISHAHDADTRNRLADEHFQELVVEAAVTDEDDAVRGSAVFGLNIIPHTAEVTTLGTLSEGDAVNLEIDVLARYLQRMQSLRS